MSNTNCIVDSGRLTTEFENLEITQAYPSTKAVKLYRDSQKKLMSSPLSIEMMILSAKLKTAKDDEVAEIQASIIELENKLSEKFDAAEGIKNLILASFEGTKYKKGGFIVDGKEETFKYCDFEELPEIVYVELVNNALKLITIQEDEEKN